MRVLVFGGTGMLGHKLWQVCSEEHEAYATVRGNRDSCRNRGVLDLERAIEGVTVDDETSIRRAVEKAEPDVVVNCIGVVKQSPAAKDPIISLTVNSVFPHRLANLCRVAGARLIHISTDCVFSGRKGNYREDDPSDAEDLYGKTKFLGEIAGEGCLTIRTSMIGRESVSLNGLVEWFLNQSEKDQSEKVVKGYRRAIFSGFTTLALSRIITDMIIPRSDLHGLWHVASEPISKLDLLSLIKEVYGVTTKIEPDDDVVCDRSLNGELFHHATGFVSPSWKTMIEEIYHDPTPYSELRRRHAHR